MIFEATEDLTALVRDAKKAIKEMGFTKKRAINKNTIQKIINEELSFIKVKLYDRLKNKLENVILSHDLGTLPVSRLSPQNNSSLHWRHYLLKVWIRKGGNRVLSGYTMERRTIQIDKITQKVQGLTLEWHRKYESIEPVIWQWIRKRKSPFKSRFYQISCQ